MYTPSETVKRVWKKRRGRAATRRAGAAAVEMLEGRRLLSAGDLDPTFGAGGFAIADLFVAKNGYADAVALQADGKVLAAGVAGPFNEEGAALARYNPDGSLDTSFATRGVFAGNLHGTTRAMFHGLAVQGDGKIVAAGSARVNGDERFLAARFNANGTLDTSFNGTGFGVIDFTAGGFDRANAVALAPAGGKIVLAGVTNPGGSAKSNMGFVRLNANGTLDTTFGGDGRQSIDILGNRDDAANAVLVQADGKVVAGGSHTNAAGNSDMAIVRLTATGAIDNTWDGDGRELVDVAGGHDAITDIAFGPNGSVIAAGVGSTDTFGSPEPDYAVARFAASGSLDPAFGGGDGVVTTNTGLTIDAWTGVAVMPDGRIVAGGYSERGGSSSFAAGRYLPDGTPDATFDGDGLWTRDFASDGDQVFDVAVQPDGRVVLAGQRDLAAVRSDFNADFGIVRLTIDGTPDASFGRFGFATGRIDGFVGAFTATATQADGKIIAVGTVDDYDLLSVEESGAFQVARYNRDGSLDLTFGAAGVVSIAVGPSAGFVDEVRRVAIVAGGKILVAGTARDAGPDTSELDYDFFAARLNADGTPDTTFGGGDGVVTADFGADDLAVALAVAADGSFALAGSTGANEFPQQTAVARFTAAGGLDNAFSGDGRLTQEFSSGYDTAKGVAIDSSGRVVIGVDVGDTMDHQILARYTTSGNPDAGYGAGGVVTVSSFQGYFLADMILDGSGRAVVALGTFETADFDVRRFTTSGQPDASFNGSGAISVGFSGADSTAGSAMALGLGAGGKVLVAGLATDVSATNFAFGRVAVVRLTDAGQLDPTFDGDGRATADIPTDGTPEPFFYDVSENADGIVVAGSIGERRRFSSTPILVRFQGGDDGGNPGGGGLLDPGTDGVLRVGGTAGNDTITVARVGAAMRVTVNGSVKDYDAAKVLRTEVMGLDGNDTISIATAGVAGTILGGNGNDTIAGGSLNDTIKGEAGNDRIDGGLGADDMSGGSGVDTLDYSSRTGNLYVGLGTAADDGEANEHDNARSDFDNVLCGSGNDEVFGNSFRNVINGGGGNDELHGGGGNDDLTGGAGPDQLYGDDGDDTFHARGDGSADFVSGGTGNDTAELDPNDAFTGVERRFI